MNQDEFRQKFAALPDLENPELGWESYCKTLREHAQNEPADEFVRWSTIQATMFIKNAPFVLDQLKVLQEGDWDRWNRLIKDPGVGKPHFHDVIDYASGQYIYQCYLLDYFEKMTGIDITKIGHVVEFGGGYGSMRNIFAQAGFEGHYTIFDLPEMSILQEYYLEQVLTDQQFEQTTLATRDMPIVYTDLIIGIASVSESSVTTRDRFFSRVTADYYFFVAQPRFYEVDNKEFFQSLIDDNAHLNWDMRKNPLPIPAHDFINGWPKDE